jgi:acyl carrier protein
MKPETFQRVLRPKVRGGWLLHHLLKDYPLDFFILFSSTGSVITSLGQGNYAAANAFLDALAYHRRSQGLPALSIGWGPWSVGMVEQLKLEQFYTKRGIELISPEAGMQILARVMGQRPAHLIVISANWSTARETSPVGTLPPMFSLLGEQKEEVATEKSNDGSLLMQLGTVQAVERQSLLESYLQELVARVLQLDPSQFSGQESLTSLGMDSMMAVEIKHRIEGSLKVDVSVLELLQGTTVMQLAARILSSLQLDASPKLDALPVATDNTLPIVEIQQLIEQTDREELERLLAELEQVSENEASV